MHASRTPRYCRCGTRLGRYHAGDLCSPCEKKLIALRTAPPEVPAEFWDTIQFRAAFAAQHVGRPDLAEAALTSALAQHLSTRRRGSVLVDLALIGVQRRDSDRLITHADAALDLARQTGSGVIGRRLRGLQAQLAPLLDDTKVRHLHQRIAAVTGASAA